MKRMQNIASKFLACGFALSVFALACPLSAANSGQGSAKVLRIEGAARYSTGNNVWQTLHVGDSLKPGTLIQTAAHSQVDLVLVEQAGAMRAAAGTMKLKADSSKGAAQQDAIRMMENTLLAIDKLLITKTGADTVRETELDLRTGRIEGSVKKLTGASKYEVKIPNGVAGIRGTIYSVSASGILSVWSGSFVLAIVGPGGIITTVVINENEQYDPATGKVTPNTQPKPEFLHDTSTPVTNIYKTQDSTIYFISPTTGEQPEALP